MTKPTIVAVHGAWHGPECWRPLAKVLQSHGYNVRAVALPSVVDEGSQPPEDPRDDIAAVREAILAVLEEGSDVLVVPHSYGGIPTTSAVKGLDKESRQADGKQTSVVGLAPISAFIAREGEDLCTCQGLEPGERVDAYKIKGPLNFTNVDDAANKFYGDLSKGEADKWIAELRPMLRTALWTLKSEHSAHKHVPVHFLLCTEDQAFSAAAQRAVIKRLEDDGASVRVEEVKSSHSPFLSMPARTSDFIRRSAGEDLPE